MSKCQSEQLIRDIVESAGKILSYTDGMTYDGFISDSKTVDAVNPEL